MGRRPAILCYGINPVGNTRTPAADSTHSVRPTAGRSDPQGYHGAQAQVLPRLAVLEAVPESLRT